MADGGSEAREFELTRKDFDRVRKFIYSRAGISLSEKKEEMVNSRLARRLRSRKLGSFKAYLDWLEDDGDEDDWQDFTNALTTNLTSFFREPHHFEILKKELEQRAGSRPLKVWCSAASTGEEPYSLAITACRAFGSLSPPVRILATDIDTNVLDIAARGIYPIERIEKLSKSIKRNYFLKGRGDNSGQCRVIEPLRNLLSFRQLNLLDSRYPMRGPFDAIFCRNVMIYFDKPTQLRVLERMAPLLSNDGLFFAGHSETFYHADHLIKSVGKTVYRRVSTTSGLGVAGQMERSSIRAQSGVPGAFAGSESPICS